MLPRSATISSDMPCSYTSTLLPSLSSICCDISVCVCMCVCVHCVVCAQQTGHTLDHATRVANQTHSRFAAPTPAAGCWPTAGTRPRQTAPLAD
jgi:hypothetical protein